MTLKNQYLDLLKEILENNDLCRDIEFIKKKQNNK